VAFQKIDDDRSSDALSPHVSSLVSAPRPATVDRLPQPGKCGAAETREGLLFVVARLVDSAGNLGQAFRASTSTARK
jgi:hypothetical protein